MMKRRPVSTFFAAVVTFAASAVSFAPVDNSASFYKEASTGEQVFMGDADSANLKFVVDKAETISDLSISTISGTETVNVTDSTFKIGTGKCYVASYKINGDGEKSELGKTYLTYFKKQATSPSVTVVPDDSASVCDEKMTVRYKNLVHPNSFVNSRGETVTVEDNFVLTYEDYEANGIEISTKTVEEDVYAYGSVDSVTSRIDTIQSITRPRKHTVFKLKDKLTQYVYVSDTFHTSLPFSVAQITMDAEAIPHNTEKRSDDALVFFNTLDEAKRIAGDYMYSGPLDINLERNSVDNAPVDTVISQDPADTTKKISTLVPQDAKYTWKFYNDSTGALRVCYNTIHNLMSISDLRIENFGTHFVTLACDNGVCQQTLYTAFKVKTSLLTMPSVFTPNGDGANDEFRPTYTSIKEYKIWIYNTMGKEMYESSDITVGWDGTHKGHDCPIGAYYYVVKAKGVDNIEYKLKGTVNLVRHAED